MKRPEPNLSPSNSNRDSEQEQTNIDYLIDEGVDCIVILSWNEAGCVSAAEKCQEAGIGCVVFDACGVMKNHDVDITASVDFDWQSMGGTYVDWMTETYPGEDYVFISGTPDSVVCQTVGDRALKDATENSGELKCADIRYGEYDPETAANEAEDLGDIPVLNSPSSEYQRRLRGGGHHTSSGYGRSGQYHVFAQNGSETGVELMKEGTWNSRSRPLRDWKEQSRYSQESTQLQTTRHQIRISTARSRRYTPDDVDNPEIVIPGP